MKRKLFFAYMGVSPLQPVAYRAAATFLDDYMKLGPPEVLEKYQGYVEKLSEEVAKMLHCDASEIIYVKNTGEGIIMASESLPLKRGDEVLVLGNEYPANLIPWLKKKKDGVNVQVIGDQKKRDNAKDFQELLSRINRKTKAVAVAWGQHYDGYLADLAKLSRVCRKNGAFLVVDGVQGVASRSIDLKKIHIDFFVCGGQKYLGSIGGSGFMYVNKKVMSKLKDEHVGIRSIESYDSNGYVLRKTAARFQDGTESLISIVAIHAAVKEVNRIGIKKIEKKNLALLKTFKALLYKNNISFIDHKSQCNIIAIRAADPLGMAAFLRKNNIYTRPVKGVQRVSFTHTTTVSDIKQLIKKTRDWMDK
jgi:selenocysteine lyase/cysteine desulfurase